MVRNPEIRAPWLTAWMKQMYQTMLIMSVTMYVYFVAIAILYVRIYKCIGEVGLNIYSLYILV